MKKILVGVFCITLLLLSCTTARIHRMGSLFLELENIGGKLIAYPIIFCLITFFHYCFAFMHTSFETFMFFYNKDRFALNVANMEKRLNKK